MSLVTTLSRTLVITLAAVMVGMGLTTYTFPILGGPASGELHDLLARALGDSDARLPGPPATLAIGPLPIAPPGISADSSAGVAQPQLGTQPEAWATEAVARDSAALRGWLGPGVLPAAVVMGDTVRTTLYRITLHRGCPLLSRLQATSVGQVSRQLRIVSVRTDCPPMTMPEESAAR